MKNYLFFGGGRGAVAQIGLGPQMQILRIDTAELHRVYDNMLQRAQKCVDVQGDHFQQLL